MSRVTIRVALDPMHWAATDKGAWAMRLADAAAAAAPGLLRVERFEIGDTLVHIRMRSDANVKRLRIALREDDAFKRLRARLADLGGRPDFEIEDRDGDS